MNTPKPAFAEQSTREQWDAMNARSLQLAMEAQRNTAALYRAQSLARLDARWADSNTNRNEE